MQSAIVELSKMGLLPSSTDPDTETIEKFQTLLEAVQQPVSDEEACILVKLFGPDECFGLAWSLIHLIETAPSWPKLACLSGLENEWINKLRERVTH